MKPIEVTDEGLFDASPAEVFSALMDEVSGRSKWWRPTLEVHPRAGLPAGKVGSTVDVLIPGPPAVHMELRIGELVENERARMDYVGGDFVGSGHWTLEPLGDRTRLRFRWTNRPNTWRMRLARLFLNLGQRHSDIAQRGFAGLRGYLAAQRQPTLPAPSPGTTIETGAHL